VNLADLHADLAQRGEVTIADWAASAGMSRSKLFELRRHDPALRALPTRRVGRPRKAPSA
jgi:hypothetical protein